MREWLERLIPQGLWHTPMVDLGESVTRIGVVVLWFVVLRFVVVRGMRVMLRPLVQAAAREGETNLARARTLEGLAYSAVTYCMLFLALVAVLDQMGVNVGAILAGAGVAGLALSFGAQRVVRDILTGFFLLMEDQFRVGETITVLVPPINQVTGRVEQLGLRITRLTDPTGKLVVINNGDITMVTNHSRGPVDAAVDLGVDPAVSIEQLQDVLSAASLPGELFANSATVQGVTSVDATRLVVRVTAPAAPGKSAEGELVLRHLASNALRSAGIEVR